MKQINNREYVVGPCRFSYLTVFKARRNDLRGEDEFSTVLLFPKEPSEHAADPAPEVDALKEAIKNVATEKFGKLPPKLDVPLRDGDKETNNDGQAKHPGYWFLPVRAKAEYPPRLLDGAKRDAKEEDWVSGDWGKALVALYAYDYQGRKGVGAGLRGIQFLHKGEPFGSSSSAESAFDEEKTATAAASGEDEYDPFKDE
jgi:hypothetical protein